MIKQTIKYTDFNDQPQTEEAWFHLTKNDVKKMLIEHTEGFEEHMKKVMGSGDNKAIYAWFEVLVLGAYGIKSGDGRSFEKSEEISKTFSQTAAYDQFLDDLMSDDKIGAEFVNGIFPREYMEMVKEEELKQKAAEAMGIVPTSDPTKVSTTAEIAATLSDQTIVEDKEV